MAYIAVFVAGMLGGCLRYVLALALPAQHGFPVGTLLVNLIGSLCLGAITSALPASVGKPWLRTGITSGLIGSFTTFSAFCTTSDALGALHPVLAVSYILISLMGGPLLAFLGGSLTPSFTKPTTQKAEEVSL